VNASTRSLWLAVIILAGLIIGIAAGLLAWAGGQNPYVAILTGGGAFGAMVLFLFAIFQFATGNSGPR
jgi:hypothetical protein